MECDIELLTLPPGVCAGVCPVAPGLAFTPFGTNDPGPGAGGPSRDGGTTLECAWSLCLSFLPKRNDIVVCAGCAAVVQARQAAYPTGSLRPLGLYK